MASGSLPPSSSKSQSDESHDYGVKSYDFLADTKWWLHPQLNVDSTLLEPSWKILRKEEYAKIKEVEMVISDTAQKRPQDDCLLISENPEKLLSKMDPQLTGINKTEPWWRTADSYDLASFVPDRSLDQVDSFDPPQPQVNKAGEQFLPDKGLASLNQVSNTIEFMPRAPTSIGMGDSHSARGLDNPLSITISNEVEKLQELSKAQLLEALCHSQTRAREAEKAARQAYNEKEHMITHFLKQASHLFAYKQWFHILQLETTCLHLKNSKYQLVYTRFPDFVPWIPTKDKKPKRVRRNAANTKPGSPDKSFGSFLLGLTLTGAGLLLGWTMGWLFR